MSRLLCWALDKISYFRFPFSNFILHSSRHGAVFHCVSSAAQKKSRVSHTNIYNHTAEVRSNKITWQCVIMRSCKKVFESTNLTERYLRILNRYFGICKNKHHKKVRQSQQRINIHNSDPILKSSIPCCERSGGHSYQPAWQMNRPPGWALWSLTSLHHKTPIHHSSSPPRLTDDPQIGLQVSEKQTAGGETPELWTQLGAVS